MSKALTYAIATGVLSGGMFLVVAGVGLGFFFLFLPTLPLFYYGLSRNASHFPAAVMSAVILVSLVAGSALGIVFLFFLGLPTHYIAKYSLKWRLVDGSIRWFPIGNIMLSLMLYACIAMALASGYYMEQGISLPQMLSNHIRGALTGIEGEYDDVVQTVSDQLSFLTFPVTLWVWGLLLYAHAWFANRVLAQRGRQCRPDFAVTPFAIPSWMLSLLAIAALASLIGSESLSFLGKSTILTLMLPYFFLGTSVMHEAVKTMASRKLILFFVYLMIVTQLWPALILAAMGLWHQVKALRHSDGTVSKQ